MVGTFEEEYVKTTLSISVLPAFLNQRLDNDSHKVLRSSIRSNNI